MVKSSVHKPACRLHGLRRRPDDELDLLLSMTMTGQLVWHIGACWASLTMQLGTQANLQWSLRHDFVMMMLYGSRLPTLRCCASTPALSRGVAFLRKA